MPDKITTGPIQKHLVEEETNRFEIRLCEIGPKPR
jgi:hypothetical protein